MRRSVERRCRECGGQIRAVARAGRRAAFRHVPALPVPSDLPIPTCRRCGREYLDARTARLLDNGLEVSYRKLLRGKFERALKAVAREATQARLEQLLGLSQGYLSKVKSGERDPSPELVGELHVLARDPRRRLQELERCWRAA